MDSSGLFNSAVSDYHEAQKSIKVETLGEVKSEFLGDEATTLNLDSGLVEKNSEKRLTNAVDNKRRSKTKTDAGSIVNALPIIYIKTVYFNKIFIIIGAHRTCDMGLPMLMVEIFVDFHVEIQLFIFSNIFKLI
uniref:Uncharacterized protein n=1 Tax=Trichogramma kaykai TaxID=54128 RepID=A0ABD2XC90_9HYME